MKPNDLPVVRVIPGDLHLTEPGLENHRTALWMADEVNDLVDPDFVQFIGDNVQHATEDQFHLFRKVASRLHVPWYAMGLFDWRAALPGNHLSKGTHRLTVEAIDRRGEIGSNSIEFAVDPTGRYAAVPRVRPQVAATKFC